MRFFFLLIIVLTISLFSVSSLCTVTLNDDLPTTGQEITAAMSCDSPSEKSTSYTLTWYDQLGVPFQTDTGITPSITGLGFYENAVIPTGVTSGNVNLTGLGLEGEDNFTVQTSNNTLIITNATFSENILVGKSGGLEFKISNPNLNIINGAECNVCIKDNQGVPLGACFDTYKSVNGHVDIGIIPSIKTLREDRSYLLEISCLYSSAGTEVYDYHGIVDFPFYVNKWLDVNTVVDKDLYYAKQEVSICANITNNVYDDRLSLDIYYQLRCNEENATSTNLYRSLIASDDSEPDLRGINFNLTQTQCKRFIFSVPPYLQSKNSSCYASSLVAVKDELGENLINYKTTTPDFKFVCTDLNLNPDWQYLDDGIISTKINLSSSEYSDYSGVLKSGSIDIRLSKAEESIRHQDQYIVNEIDIEKIKEGNNIKNIKASYCNGTEITDLKLEYLNDGNLEIELRNVDTTPTGCYEVSFNIVGEDKMYLTVGIIYISVIILLFFFSDRLDFEKVTKKDGVTETKTIHTFKYLAWFVCSWLILGLINIALKVNEVASLGLSSTVGTLYTSATYIIYILSAIFIFYLIYKSLMYLGGMFSND